MNDLISQIHAFCKSAGCLPDQIILQWSPAGGCQLVVNTPTGLRIMPVITQSLDHTAKALYLAVMEVKLNGPNPNTPGQKKFESMAQPEKVPTYNFKKGVGKTGEASKPANAPNPQPAKKAILASWREGTTAAEVMGLFPKTPTGDDLLDLYELNKKIQSQELTKLLQEHSQKLNVKR